jgi:4-amino-4-deoxy-L-arabinose transferase-like glycosyltransferase
MKTRVAVALILGSVVVATLSFRLAAPPLHTDEITYMNKVLESLLQGRGLPVRSSGHLFVNKPPLALWLIRASFATLQASPFAARLPSVIAAAATAVVLFLFAAAVFNQAVGVSAALLFALVSSPLALHGLRSATPDALEICLVTVAIVCLELWRRRRRRWALICLVASSTATAWVKSPYAIAIVLFYFLATEVFARRAGLGTPHWVRTMALVAVAWSLAFAAWLGTIQSLESSRAVSRGLFRQQYLKRLEGTMGRTHGQDVGFYGRRAVEDFGPFLLLPVAAAVATRLRRRRGPPPPTETYDTAFLVAWSVTAFALATVSASKQPWYVYPSYPGIALGLAVAAWRLGETSGRRWVAGSILAATLVSFAARLPADQIWPAEPPRLDRLVRFWEIASRDQRIRVQVGPRLRFGRSDRARESRFYILSLLWSQQRRAPDEMACRTSIVNQPGPGSESVVELLAPMRASQGLYVVGADGCDPALRRQLEPLGSAQPVPRPTIHDRREETPVARPGPRGRAARAPGLERKRPAGTRRDSRRQIH